MEEVEEAREEETEDTSACDASFRAEDAVPTSGHDTVSRCTENEELFLEAVRQHLDKSEEFDFEESLGTLTPDEITALWVSLHKYLSSGEKEEASGTIAGVSLIARFTVNLDMINGDFIPDGLSSSAVLLHSLLPEIKDTKTIGNVCYFLETWYSRDLPERDLVVFNVLLFLLRKSLGPQAAKADLKRIWNLHQTVMEHKVEEGQSLHKLLVATAGSNMYLSTQEGVRWLVFLFNLSPDLVLSLHNQVSLNYNNTISGVIILYPPHAGSRLSGQPEQGGVSGPGRGLSQGLARVGGRVQSEAGAGLPPGPHVQGRPRLT